MGYTICEDYCWAIINKTFKGWLSISSGNISLAVVEIFLIYSLFKVNISMQTFLGNNHPKLAEGIFPFGILSSVSVLLNFPFKEETLTKKSCSKYC